MLIALNRLGSGFLNSFLLQLIVLTIRHSQLSGHRTELQAEAEAISIITKTEAIDSMAENILRKKKID
jgi:hypothetical protein